MRFELVFAGFEVFARLEDEYAADKDPGLIDYSLAHQNVGNIANADAARVISDPIVGQRTRGVESLLAGDQRYAARHGEQNKNTDDGVAENDKRMPRAF